jgi:hypothetical protein
MRVGKKRAAILAGAAYAAATAVAGTLTAVGAALALARPAPLTKLPPLAGRARRDSAPRGRSLAGAARALARGETWLRREQIVARARSWHLPDPAETMGVGWTLAGVDEAPATGPVLWGIASARTDAIVAFFPTRARAEAALREVRAEHPGLADDSRRVVRVDLGLSTGDCYRPECAGAMHALPPRIIATSPGPRPFFLLQG